ncbi:MAG: phosphoribosyltransferase family protein [Planctomycetota bacterium]|nr:phosphoribosyltransferase family protein [Planctomycetota bacterium]
MLGHQIGVELTREGRDPHLAVVVPIPTSWRHQVVRGIDHTRWLARGVARHLDVPVCQLLRRSHRPAQAGLPAGARKRNVRGAFSCRAAGRWPRLGSPHTIVLVDDVMTTGATMREAARTLAKGLRGPDDPRTHWDFPAIWVSVAAVASIDTNAGAEVSERASAKPAEAIRT